MDLVQATWMIRDLGQPVSAIKFCDDYSVIAGGWDGRLSFWDSDGKLLWSVDCEDRIESILNVDDNFIVTSGLHIVCVKDGEIIWQHALEGSADMLAFHEGKIIATSSVYDIEHGDFMESAIWQFTIDGDLENVERMDERPWFITSRKSLVIGLGRPRCGLLVDGNHVELQSESPVMCGINGREEILFGHADGTITKYPDEIIGAENESIESIICTKEGFIMSLENGDLISRNSDYVENWRVNCGKITTHCDGFSSLHWSGVIHEGSGNIEVRDSSGQIIAKAKTPEPRVSTSLEQRVAFGLDDGQIFVWESDLFDRRKDTNSESVDSRKSALSARLRSLRK